MHVFCHFGIHLCQLASQHPVHGLDRNETIDLLDVHPVALAANREEHRWTHKLSAFWSYRFQAGCSGVRLHPARIVAGLRAKRYSTEHCRLNHGFLHPRA